MNVVLTRRRKMNSMDTITLQQAHFWCYVGCDEVEKQRRQEVIIDVVLFLDLHKAAATDDLKDTVCYVDVQMAIKSILESKKYNLIESMAVEIADRVLSRFPVQKVKVRVAKPGALRSRNVEKVIVEIERIKE